MKYKLIVSIILLLCIFTICRWVYPFGKYCYHRIKFLDSLKNLDVQMPIQQFPSQIENTDALSWKYFPIGRVILPFPANGNCKVENKDPLWIKIKNATLGIRITTIPIYFGEYDDILKAESAVPNDFSNISIFQVEKSLREMSLLSLKASLPSGPAYFYQKGPISAIIWYNSNNSFQIKLFAPDYNFDIVIITFKNGFSFSKWILSISTVVYHDELKIQCAGMNRLGDGDARALR